MLPKANSASRRGLQQGFNLLELVVVFVLVGVLAATAVGYYAKLMRDAEKTGLMSVARQFSAVVSGLHAQWFVNRVNGQALSPLLLEDQSIAMNEFGWPVSANTSAKGNGARHTAEQCEQLWHAFSRFIVPASIEGKTARGSERFHISLPQTWVCRFELVKKAQNSYYFDYNLRTGLVKVTTPDLETNQE